MRENKKSYICGRKNTHKIKSMKRSLLYLPLFFILASCIQDEPLNSEADILTCAIKNEQGLPEMNIKGNILIDNSKVMALAIPKIDLTKLAPEFTITEGATISPASGTMRDFSEPQQYTVTSQDGKWQKIYTISVDTSDMQTKYDFENFETAGKFQKFFEVFQTKDDSVFKQYIWASGNGGFALTGVAFSPEEFPTVSSKEGWNNSRALKVVTKSTGSFGEMARMPIAAGNLFIGSFDVNNAMKKPLEATLFGLPFGKKPVAFRGRYVYKMGDPFVIRNAEGKKEEVPGRKDIGDIYAVLYDAENGSLNGENVLTSPYIIAMARVSDMKVTDNATPVTNAAYVEFNIPFDYASYAWRRPFIEEKSKQYKYNLAVVFTSSRDGADFAGALGSTLYVDDVEVICE